MNNYFATSQGVLSFESLDASLREINNRRFRGLLRVDADSEEWWTIVHPERGFPFRITISLRSKRKIELRPSGGKFGWWMLHIFQSELAAKFKGKCSDEGDRRSLAPHPEHFPTFKSFCDDLYTWHGSVERPERYAEVIKQQWEWELENLPEDLHVLV